MNQSITLAERFQSKWEPEPFSGCWLWTGCVLQNGYGYLWPNKKAHRASWELNRGKIPKDKFVLHKCDVKTCVNPDHLYLGTPKDNSIDASVRGKLLFGERNSSSKLTEDQVRQIRVSIEPSRKVGLRFGVTHRVVLLIRKGKLWTRTKDLQ